MSAPVVVGVLGVYVAVTAAAIGASVLVGVLAWLLGLALGAVMRSLDGLPVPLVGLARHYWHALLSRPKGGGRGVSRPGRHSTPGASTHPGRCPVVDTHPRPVDTTPAPMPTPATTLAGITLHTDLAVEPGVVLIARTTVVDGRRVTRVLDVLEVDEAQP